MTRLEICFLDSASDDYENIASTKNSLRNIYNINAVEESLVYTLSKVSAMKLVDLFIYNSDKSEFERIHSLEEAKPEDVWFLTNKEGLSAVEREWRDAWN